MPQASSLSRSDDPLLRSAKREALFAASLWLAAAVYSLSYCASFGYHRDVADLTFVFGMPDWVFWGVVVPWVVCASVSCVFAAFVMRDDPLGPEREMAGLAETAGEPRDG